MKRLILIVAVSLAGLLTGCFEKSGPPKASGPLWRSHFAGVRAINENTNPLVFKKVWNLPSSGELRKQALDKIAQTPFQLWQKSLPAGVTNGASLIRPLLDDLINSESFVEVKGPESDFDSALAIQLDATRAQLWKTNLWQLLQQWKFSRPKPLPDAAMPGWESRGNGITVRVQWKDKWLLAGWSRGKLEGLSALSFRAPHADRPVPALGDSLLEWHADLPSLARWSPALAKFKLVPIDASVSARGEYLRTEARLALAEPLSWKFQPWQIPTNIISDPLVSFTVAQDIEPLLKTFPGYGELGLKSAPSQMCAWAFGELGLRNYWAFPVDHSSNVLYQIAPRFGPFVRHYFEGEPMGSLVYATNTSELHWMDLPLLAPVLRSVTTERRDYLLLSLAPLPLRIKIPPPDLFAQLKDRNDLLYYDWEITEHRLQEWKRLYQRIDMSHLRLMGPTNAPSLKWPDDVSKLLGNTATEVTVTSPEELKLVRKSHFGFTGFELMTLLRWIDSPAFPLGYEPPAPIPRSRTGKKPPTQQRHPNAPVPNAPLKP